MITWLLRLFCKHEQVVLVKTYAPPSNRLKSISGNPDVFERIVHGCTTVLVRCPKCGHCEKFTMLGKESE